MVIKIWSNFSKKKNSTKQPTGGTDVTVTLKQPTSILHPAFFTASIPASCNYIYCADFGRYYFVNDIVRVNKDMLEIHCDVDPMATAKSIIQASIFYIIRSASLYNGAVSDGEVIPTNDVVQAVQSSGDLLSNLNLNSQAYVARVVGKNGAKNYLVNDALLSAVFNSYLDVNNLDWSSPENALNALFVCMADPSSYIKSVKWFPFDLNSSGTETPYFGFVEYSGTTAVVSSVQDGTTTITIPARYYNDWRDFDSRFTQCNIFLPGVGTVGIDPKHLENNQLSVWYYSDVDTGAGVAVLADGTAIISTHGYQCGCDVPIGGLTGTNLISSLSSLARSGLSVSRVMSAAEDVVGAQMHPTDASMSAGGNRRYWQTNPEVIVSIVRLGSTGAPGATKGRPAMQTANLSGLSGYVQCDKASIDCPYTDTEKDQINAYLNSGFYIE